MQLLESSESKPIFTQAGSVCAVTSKIRPNSNSARCTPGGRLRQPPPLHTPSVKRLPPLVESPSALAQRPPANPGILLSLEPNPSSVQLLQGSYQAWSWSRGPDSRCKARGEKNASGFTAFLLFHDNFAILLVLTKQIWYLLYKFRSTRTLF